MEWTRSSKGLGRRSLDALRVGVLVLDAEDRPVLANPSAHDMGLLRAGIAGSPNVAHSLIRTLAGQVRRTGQSREVELDMPRSRALEPLGVHIRAVALGDGHVTVEALDVTESHRLTRVRRDFVANVSHELKTPVGALQLLSEALAEAMGDGGPGTDMEAARRFADRIQHESTRLGRLIAELLELSRLQGGEPLPAPDPVSVERVVAEVIDRTRTTAAAKGLEVIWTGARRLSAYGSESQLVTALANLVENAIAYTPEPPPEKQPVQIIVTTRATDDEVRLAVTDHGIGIEAKDRDRIFERFYRADRARSRDTGGTGLGLAIVKHIATNHGGRVDVTSLPGEGSTFTLRLPGRPPEAALPLPQSVEVIAGVGGDAGE